MNFLFDSLSKVDFATHTTGKYRPNRDGNRDRDTPERQVAFLMESQHPSKTDRLPVAILAQTEGGRGLKQRLAATIWPLPPCFVPKNPLVSWQRNESTATDRHRSAEFCRM